MSAFGYIGSNNGEFGFPFRFTAGSPDDAHPFTSTVGALLRLYYGVKDWTLDTDLVLHSSTGDFSLPNGVIPPVAGSPADKFGLLIGSNKASASQTAWSVANLSPPQPSPSGVGWSLYQSPKRVISNSGAFYPYIDVNAFVNNDTSSESVQIVTQSSGATAAINGKLKLGGGFPDIPFPLYYVLAGVPTPTYTMTKFNLSPSTLWS